jgi:hypothetical protein
LVAKEKDRVAMENRKRILAVGLFINLILAFLSVNLLEAAPGVRAPGEGG